MAPDEDRVVLDRIEDWRRRLIDLSYRNRLIRYRPTKATTLEIEAPSLDVLLADLERTTPWRFYFPPEPEEEPEESSNEAAIFVDAAVVHAARHVDRPPRADEIVVRESNPRHINRILENLARKSNAEFQDKALRILYIAAGFLDWVDTSRNEALNSPLILVPVELRRESARHPYALYFVDDEDTVVNPSLTEKLRRDLGRDIPLDWAWEDKPVEVELNEIEEAIAGSGWSVQRRAVLGLFSFQKFVMYRDLLDNEERIARHALVRSLAVKRLTGKAVGEDIEVPAQSELDDAQPPQRDLLILDADATQRRAIEAAKRGQSFVMHGPPGTGKSQTIANVIAEVIGAGKRVLFVSEKAAALDVVHRRLTSKGLDEFCLMLHGEHAARREVVESLHRSLTSEIVPRIGMKSHELQRLADLREMLNSSADLVHLPIPTLGDRSMRDVLGYLAELYEAPSIPKAPAASDATGDGVRTDFQKLDDIFQRIAERWSVSSMDFVWRGYEADRFSSEQHGQVLADLRRLRGATQRVADDAGDCGRLLGWSVPINLRAVDRLLTLGAHLELAPNLAEHWLDSDPGSLVTTAEEAQAAFEAAAQKETEFATVYPTRSVEDFAADLLVRINARLKSLTEVAGSTDAWERELLLARAELGRFLASAPALADEVLTTALDAAARFGQPTTSMSLERAEEIAKLATLAFTEENRPEADWLVRAGLELAQTALNETREMLEQYQSDERRLMEQWEADALHIDASDLLSRFTTQHTAALAKLRGSYRRDAKTIKAVRRDRKLPKDVIQSLTDLAELQRLGVSVDDQTSRLRRAFGSYFHGRETRMNDVEDAIRVASEVNRISAANSDLEALASMVCVGSKPDPHTAQLADRLRADTADLAAGVERLRPFIGRPTLLSTHDALTVLRDHLAVLGERLNDLVELVEQLSLNSQTPVSTLTHLRDRAGLIDNVHALRAQISTRGERWQETLAPYYAGSKTNWARLSKAIEWVRALRDLTGPNVPKQLQTMLLVEDRRWPDFRGLGEARESYVESTDALVHRFETDRAQELKPFTEQERFDDVQGWCERLEHHVDDLSDWVEFRAARSRAADFGWNDFVQELVGRGVQGPDVVDSFRRAYWNRRLEALFDAEPELADRGSTYERWIAEFRDLDRRLVESGADRLIHTRNKNRTAHVAVAGSEVALLRTEAAKKRRHRPVRKLLAAIPALLSDLKPCLMMSPLTVSHFLSPNHEFDVVIFDEASQVPPQDAINCVYRGRQLIVAGDGRQLPPTPFFQVSELEDSWRDEIEETTEDMESVLDSCEALLPEHSLRWHYRSRHERLIAFSNQHVYDGSLLTFPSADDLSATKGVRFVHVPAGLYDRGRTSTNRVEAEAVAKRVLSHLQHGRHSVGVITFNLAQANAVSEELDRLRIQHPEIERHFAGDRLDAVFVKHLESVQGDERDVIVFSVGYGRDRDGKFTMNFGPLNKEGGYRRLNVAVTRARELVEVVSSVRAADFTLSDTASRGARLLREYLRYAETHGASLEARQVDAPLSTFASPLEAAIGEAVGQLGYEPVPQVGAGSFRIDVAVRDPLLPEAYVLGILTDSVFYSSTPTARDRDRLREEVLTKILGWRIHRIWALDWVRNRQAEVERLRLAIEDGRSKEQVEEMEGSPPEERERSERAVMELQDAVDAAELPWVDVYQRAELPTQSSFYEFHISINRDQQRDLLVALVEVESPVHIDYAIQRLAQAWGLKRTGHKIRQAGLQAVNIAVRKGLVEKRGQFIWRPGQELATVRSPNWADPRTHRSIDQIAPEEIDLALSKLVEASGGVVGEHLFSDAAKILGFDRVGANILKTLKTRLRAAQSATADHG